MQTLLDNIIHSPQANLIVEKVKSILEVERRKRMEFYNFIKDDQKVEFINGEMIFQSPAKMQHNDASFFLAKLLSIYADKHDLGKVFHEKTLTSFSRNDYEPDICFFTKSKSDNFQKTQMQFPPPDLIVEVLSESTENIDRGIKFEDYAAHNVIEYWILDPELETIEQYILSGDNYSLIIKSNSGLIRSKTIEGFEIPIRAVFDKNENLRTLENLLKSS